MTEVELPRPGAMLLRLVGVTALVALPAALLVIATAPVALDFPSAELGTLCALLSAVVVASLLATALAGAALVRRTAPLYRALRRALAGDAEAPPPSQAAMLDAHRAPDHLVAVISGTVALVLASGAFLLVERGLSPQEAAATGLYGASVGVVGAFPAALLYRRCFWRWLGRVPPADVALPVARAIARRIGARTIVPVAAVGVGTLSVLVAHGAPAPVIGAAAVVAIGGLLLAIVTGRRLGRAVAADIASLTEEITALAAADPRAAAEAASRLARPYRTAVAVELASAVTELAGRYTEAAAAEARAREAVESAQRLKSRFLAYMSHDLRSPLNSIQGFAEILAKGTDGALVPQQAESVEMIRQSGDELLRLVTDILDSARIEAGRLVLHRQWTPSVEIVTLSVGRVADAARERRVEVTTEIAAGLPPVHADSARIVQAVGSALGKLVETMDGGTVRVRVRTAEGPPGPERQLRIEAIDAGGAMKPAERARMLEAFAELDEATRRRGGGLGLALSLARALVRAHGGDLWIDEAPGPGLALRVALPLEGPT